MYVLVKTTDTILILRSELVSFRIQGLGRDAQSLSQKAETLLHDGFSHSQGLGMWVT